MTLSAATLIPGAGLLALSLLISGPLRAQAADASLPAATPAMDLASIGPSSNAAAPSMERALARATMAAFSPWVSPVRTEPAYFENIAFFADQAQENPQDQPKPPPSSNPPAPTLGDLGLSPDQIQGSPQDQARLDKRAHMLKIHQRLGLITTVPLIATVFSGGLAGGKATSSTARDFHAALGSVTAGLYFTTAYYSIFAPRVPGTQTRGPIRLHKMLAWIHGPGMILTPILGAMAFDQRSRGEKVHGIANAHGAVGAVTAVAYGLAIVSVSIKF